MPKRLENIKISDHVKLIMLLFPWYRSILVAEHSLNNHLLSCDSARHEG